MTHDPKDSGSSPMHEISFSLSIPKASALNLDITHGMPKDMASLSYKCKSKAIDERDDSKR
jgi:hypothetical protein